MTDFYEDRHLLEPNMVFESYQGDLVMLDRRVPGDGTRWYVADMVGDKWFFEDGTIEPGDLVKRREDLE